MILVQAHHLTSQVFHYNSCLNNFIDSTQKIYVSSSGQGLPIVIGIGARNLITPNPTDFDGEIKQSNLSSLKQVNGTTPVCGEGDVRWDIEDFYVTRWSVVTKAYYVPSTTIYVFSSQVYIGTNSTSRITLKRTGLQLTFTNGTILYFPISNSNHLPFVLTQTSLDKKRKPKSSLKMSTFGTKVYSSGTEIYNSLIEHSIFEFNNFNLNPSQQELLTWHC